jgi:GntR family transcriptional regulator, rspAB operon transcriptional repressor
LELTGTERPRLHLANLSEQVYKQIKQDILLRKIKFGERISEQGLCKKYEVSRTPVREAIQMLDADGLVENKSHHYTKIIKLSKNDERDLVQIRMILETVSLIEISKHFSVDDYNELMGFHDRCVQALEKGDVVELEQADSRFHLELARRSGNTFLYDAYRRIDAKLSLLQNIESFQKDRSSSVVAMHTTILKCLQDKDLDGAVHHIRNHIWLTSNLNDFVHVEVRI